MVRQAAMQKGNVMKGKVKSGAAKSKGVKKLRLMQKKRRLHTTTRNKKS